MKQLITLVIFFDALCNLSCYATKTSKYNADCVLSEQVKKDNFINLAKKRYNNIFERGDHFANTEFLNLYFAIKDDLNGEELKIAKDKFKSFYEEPLYMDELRSLAERWSTQIDDTAELNRKVAYEKEKRFKRFCDNTSINLYINKDIVEYAKNEFGKNSDISQLFEYVCKENTNAEYSPGKNVFVVYEDILIFTKHHGPAGDGLPFPTEEPYVSTPWLVALFYMLNSIDCNTGAIDSDNNRTYCELCYNTLKKPKNLDTAKIIWGKHCQGNLTDFLAETYLKTASVYRKLASKEKATECLTIRIKEHSNIYPEKKEIELRKILDIVFTNSNKKIVPATAFVDICYDLYETYQKDVDAKYRIDIIDNCLSAFDDIQEEHLQWDYSRKSPIDMLMKKKTVIVGEYGKDSDEYKNFITDDVVGRFGEYSEEYDTIVKD